MTSPLISAAELRDRLAAPDPRLLVVDASFDLSDTQAGERGHAAARIPGAVYLHLDRDLSAPKSGLNGRHPLPTREAFAARMAAAGAQPDSAIVVYDGSGGMYAARLWWMLRWAGHADVRLLDGGMAAWRALGGSVEGGPAAPRAPGRFALQAPLVEAVDHATLRAGLGRADAPLVVDARSADRFRGENETLDPVGGHIPGAANRFFRDNLAADGRFKPAETLRAEWRAVIGDRPAGELVQQCGSGVTACHNLLALEVAGLGTSRLYPGSWSEWSAQPGAPIAVGA
jgi:thiosulfate/3-mercaptopyruvate sulfurtransferase